MKAIKTLALGLTLGLSIACTHASVYSPSTDIVNANHLIQAPDTPDIITITKEYAYSKFGDALNGPSIMEYVHDGIIKEDAAKTMLYPSLRKFSEYVIIDQYHADVGSMVLKKSSVDIQGKSFVISGVYAFTKDGHRYKVGVLYYTEDASAITPKNSAIMVYPIS